MKNYHTHTKRCGHAQGEDREYVEAAILRGFDTLGFSDHVPWPYKGSYRHPRVRMDVTQLPEYISAVAALREEYRDRITILTGFECEYFPEYIGWLRDTAQEYRLDYLILGNHYDTTDETGMYFGNVHTPQELRRYVDLTVQGLETGLFSYLAHPDLFMRDGYPYDADARAACRDLCQCCLSLDIPMEFNLHERFMYSWTHRKSYPNADFFEEVRAQGVKVLLGVDAHSPEEIRDGSQWMRGEAELQAFGDRFLPGIEHLLTEVK